MPGAARRPRSPDDTSTRRLASGCRVLCGASTPDTAAATAARPGVTLLAYLDLVRHPTDIGISTSAYAELMLPAALESIAEHASFAEIRSFGLHTLLSKRNRAEAQAAGLTYSVHGPFGYTGIWDLDEAERLKALDEHRRHLEASAEIGARLYVVHPDWRPEVKPRDPAVVAQLDRSFETLLVWQDELGVESWWRTCRAPGCRTSPTRATSTCTASASSSTSVTPASAAASTTGSTTRARRCVTCTCTTTTVRATHDDPHLGLGAGVIDAAAVMDAARAAGASVVLEHDSADAVQTSLARLRELGLL